SDLTDAHSITIAWGDGTPDTVLELAPGVLAYSATHRYLDDQPTATASDVNTVTVTADDGNGGIASATTSVTVNNLPPVVTSVEGPTSPLPLGSAASVSVTFGDVGTLDTHTVRISWDDGTADTVLSSGGFIRTATHTYAAPGVYTVGITVTDDDTGVATAMFQYIVIHEPSGGFVTGGGWIISPPGAYVADPSLSGKATFGFVAKPKSGLLVPVGETEFQLHVAKFKFRSTVYEGLAIAGPLAQYTGSGTVNGAGNYGFMVTVTDGKLLGVLGLDGFRIKIWNKATGAVVYDNVLGALDVIGAANPQVIGGGSIVIHKAN
ncbi:MAG TPA: PKD domain-containing protein, partial [Verrucomicrobiae bacterium]|nr:PKD domain-containing protein [Verrucomicrobiae bacterium]